MLRFTPPNDPVASLRRFLQDAFAAKQAAAARGERISKRRPLGIADTGLEAASKYRFRHPGSASKASSLRKLDRANRIERGDRPLKFDVPGKRERKVAAQLRARSA
ncbi:MAG: hypothetical protein JO107_00125 [Hyphomicrobiales bacterium]|nr:hypothetical protein [Hyphomicrobiales bacterium]